MNFKISRFSYLIAAYVTVFFVLRVLISATIGVDDVEQMVYAQDWRLGYNPSQPPLYTWLVLLASKLVGVSNLAPQLVRYSILLLTFVFLYQCSRRIVKSGELAAIAAFSPILIYFVGWGTHQGFTHSALVGAVSAATLYALLRIAENGTWRAYLRLGLVLGIGLQSKYNFGLIAMAMIIAFYWSEIADKIGSRQFHLGRLAVSIVIALAMVAPAAWWLLDSYDLNGVLSGYVNYKPAGDTPAKLGRVPSLWSIVRSSSAFIASFLIPAIIFFPQAVRRIPVTAPRESFDGGAPLGRFFVVVYALMMLASIAGVLEHVKIRWMYPILILFPLYFFYRVERIGYEASQLRRWRTLLFGFVALTMVLWVLQPHARNLLCGRCRLFEPYPHLASQIAAASGFREGTLIAADEHIAGNLRSQFPAARTLCMTYRFYVPARAHSGQCLLVWNTKNGDAIPASLAEWTHQETGYQLTGTERASYVEGTNSANGRSLRLGYARIDECHGSP